MGFCRYAAGSLGSEPGEQGYLVQWATVFGELIDETGAQSVMYGMWPALERSFDFPSVTESYRTAADAIGALFAPAGEAWQRAWAQDSTLPLTPPRARV
jgi:hypothetical protein